MNSYAAPAYGIIFVLLVIATILVHRALIQRGKYVDETKQRCTRQIPATIVKYETKDFMRRNAREILAPPEYAPSYEYQYENQTYSSRGYKTTKNPKRVPHSASLRINPDNPKEIYDGARPSDTMENNLRSARIILAFSSLMFLLAFAAAMSGRM